jgi:Protein of unknown function (DUF3795)
MPETKQYGKIKIRKVGRLIGRVPGMDESLTSYCGLCCSDCIPSRADFFELVDNLDTMLNDLQFEHYAELKSEQNQKFREYPTFLSVLHEIQKLRCTGPCRNGGGYPQCTIRQCAKDKGFSGCWQCSARPDCALLDRLRTVHPHLDYHLDLIQEMGPAEWCAKRKAHYRWQVKGK